MNCVLQDLVRIVTQIVEKINSIPRPDLGFRKSEYETLWDIEPNDELVQNAMIEIKQILMEHLAVTQNVVNVYDEYEFIIKEKENIQEYLKNATLNRDEFLEKINMYQAIIKKIQNEMPFEIRMSMFLVNCEELNNKLISDCESIVNEMLGKIADYVQIDLAPQIVQSVRNIKAKFAERVSTTRELVDALDYLDEAKQKEQKNIIINYNDMMEWLRFLYKYP